MAEISRFKCSPLFLSFWINHNWRIIPFRPSLYFGERRPLQSVSFRQFKRSILSAKLVRTSRMRSERTASIKRLVKHALHHSLSKQNKEIRKQGGKKIGLNLAEQNRCAECYISNVCNFYTRTTSSQCILIKDEFLWSVSDWSEYETIKEEKQLVSGRKKIIRREKICPGRGRLRETCRSSSS